MHLDKKAVRYFNQPRKLDAAFGNTIPSALMGWVNEKLFIQPAYLLFWGEPYLDDALGTPLDRKQVGALRKRYTQREAMTRPDASA